MTKDVIITICGLQNGPETDGEPIEMAVVGEYYFKNNKHYIFYEEVMEGESQPTKNRIQVSDGQMELFKTGAVTVHMIFVENEKNITNYQTPYGCLMMGIDAKKVSLATMGKYFPNTPLLAAIVKVAGIMGEDIFLKEMEASFKHKFASKPEVIDGNMAALKMAMQEVQ